MNKESLSHKALTMTIRYTHLAPSHNLALRKSGLPHTPKPSRCVACVREIDMSSELLIDDISESGRCQIEYIEM
jgi:hypothetical protein